MFVNAENRMNAEERRDEVLQAAAVAFAHGGYEGTSTQDVATRAGISQPYIFRLFGTKKELFIAVVEDCNRRTAETFERAAQGLDGLEALYAMGVAYQELIRDPVVLQVQMHSYTAAAADPDVRRVAQRGMRRVWETAAAASGADVDDLRQWLAYGMLCNVVAALELDKLPEPWARGLTGAAHLASPATSPE
jgi:AcrR family transcriptional regulator